MIWLIVKDGYRKGENKELDLRFSQYKKVNLFTGKAHHAALSTGEAKILIELWNKEQKLPWTLTVQDVTKLVEFTEKILFWRKSDRRENARLRMEHLRKELKEAAKNGDAKALRKKRENEKPMQWDLRQIVSENEKRKDSFPLNHEM